MSFRRRFRNIDALVSILEAIIEKSQCSLSVQEVNLLQEAIVKLQILRRKKGLTDKHLQPNVVEIVELINQFLIQNPQSHS